MKLWTTALRCADASAQISDDDLDFVRFVEDASNVGWVKRLEKQLEHLGMSGRCNIYQ